MSAEFYDGIPERHPQHLLVIKTVRKQKRLRIAFCIWDTWDQLQKGGDLFVMDKVDGIFAFNDGLSLDKTIYLLEHDKPGDNIHQILLDLQTSTIQDTTWTINEEWYYELIADVLYGSNNPKNRWRSERSGSNYKIASLIQNTNGLSMKEKIDCILDIYTFQTKTSPKTTKERITKDYLNIKKLMDWLTETSSQEPNRIHHAENAIKKLLDFVQPHVTREDNWAKLLIVDNRNQIGFCEAVLAAAKKSWGQQIRRETGKISQLGLSIKKETKEKLKLLSNKYLLSETQILEIIIKSEFKKETHLKEFNKIIAAIEEI
ncbi:hypothetical protein [Vogesella indigofera]|uniref:hypothetical protein n=1 Tax=Vogesella indigofera TaxID=45465 RepID=UPI00234EBA1B|nr:hypothetical protein [Vogesella indigofera]MDC7700295.1 hypothetical protein [Vogesella indigofera]